VNITRGISEVHKPDAARLYWQAFGEKLGRIMGPEPKALSYIARVMRPDHALTALDDHGRLLGVAGFKTSRGALVDGGLRDLVAVYGLPGGAWRACVLGILARDTENERFLMDGIFVAAEARGRGIGTALLDAIAVEAFRRGYGEVRLDVIDSNFRARALYERHGFRPVKSVDIGVLHHLFGFRRATTMVRPLKSAKPAPSPRR
jgi:ribosomal protein S18 acetylase RimI-like enzyme